MAAISIEDVQLQEKTLQQPNLNDVCKVLADGLPKHFQEVKVEVVDCPDLTQPPFTLTCPGLNGSPTIIELGGPPYLLPLVRRDKVYDLKGLRSLLAPSNDPVHVIGAGAGPWPRATVNCEGIYNMAINKDGTLDQRTRIVRVVPETGKYVQEVLPQTESRCALLANLLATHGKPGKVLKVHCKTRIGQDDFAASIRKTLQIRYGSEDVLGLGGTFLLKQGKAKQHVMPDFSKEPITSDEGVNEWLKFYNMSAPLVAVGTLVTGEYDLDLRVQHFHSFSHHGDGGHYHIDVTPEEAEYLGYFVLGEKVCRLDRPKDTHKVGRD